MNISLTDIATIAGLIVILGGIVNTVFLAWLRSRFVPRSFLFCSKNGTPIYRTISECEKELDKLKVMQREKDEQIAKQIREQMETIKADQKLFMTGLDKLFQAQTAQITAAVKNAVNQTGP